MEDSPNIVRFAEVDCAAAAVAEQVGTIKTALDDHLTLSDSLTERTESTGLC